MTTLAEFTYADGTIRLVRRGNGMLELIYGGHWPHAITADKLLTLFADIKQHGCKVTISPGSHYDRWHICYCPECRLQGGRIFDHSQASFNDHLRHVSNDDLFTFPTAERITA